MYAVVLHILYAVALHILYAVALHILYVPAAIVLVRSGKAVGGHRHSTKWATRSGV